jgi:hypothetical protein
LTGYRRQDSSRRGASDRIQMIYTGKPVKRGGLRRQRKRESVNENETTAAAARIQVYHD